MFYYSVCHWLHIIFVFSSIPRRVLYFEILCMKANSVMISSKMSFCRYKQLAFVANFSSCFPGLILLLHGWTWVLSCPVWNFTIKQRQVTTLRWLIAESTLIATIILEIWLVLAWTKLLGLIFRFIIGSLQRVYVLKLSQFFEMYTKILSFIHNLALDRIQNGTVQYINSETHKRRNYLTCGAVF